MKMPGVVKLLVATAVVSLILRGLSVVSSLLSWSQSAGVPSEQLWGAVAVNVAASAIAGGAIWAAFARPKSAYLLLTLYPVAGLVIYPLQNALQMSGFYPPPPRIPDEQLEGAAAYDLMRYAWFIGMFVWFRLSKSVRPYLGANHQVVPNRTATASN